jgi:acyl carrier protein
VIVAPPSTCESAACRGAQKEGMSVENRRADCREFIQQNFFVSEPFSDDDSLLGRGIIDSMGVLELVAFVETEYGIRVPDEDLLPSNFDSVAGLAAYIDASRETQR